MRWVCACFVEFCAGWVFSARRRLARASVLGGLTVMPGSRDGRCAWAAPIGKRRRPGVSTRVRRLLAHTARISGVARTSACWVGSAVPMCVRSREILTQSGHRGISAPVRLPRRLLSKYPKVDISSLATPFHARPKANCAFDRQAWSRASHARGTSASQQERSMTWQTPSVSWEIRPPRMRRAGSAARAS
jgi:hypothetical protein